jgi:chromosome segregation ATPase
MFLNPFYKIINQDKKSNCSILIENKTHPFKGGLLFNATPPNKKYGFGTEGLSTGELALANICFFLTVNQVLDSPFIVFDESDANLDKLNLVKYIKMMRRLRQRQQVIYISHKRSLFDHAQTLIGVTRAPNQSSKIFSLKV